MTGIIGAMEPEILLLRDAMRNTQKVTENGFEFITGTLEGKNAILLRGGIGKVNSAVGCALLAEKFKPAAVINTGSAGGIDPRLSIGDAVISSGLVEWDVDVTAFNYQPGQVPGSPPVFTVEENLIEAAEKAVHDLKAEGILPGDFKSLRGIIGSADTFVHKADKIDLLRKTFPDILAVEMEGAAIAHTCSLFKIPCLVIRAVSDVAGSRSAITHDEFLAVASKHSAEIVRRIIANFRPV
jgi:adenosylhomocysteine nucleosidase